MTKLEDICNRDIFFELVSDKWITARSHPTLDLTIYKYSKAAPYHFKSGEWPEELMIARGLVLNSEEEIIGRGFRKFFNYGEVPMPDTTDIPIVFEKLDGSCILGFNYQDQLVFSTLGSFESDQAIWAAKFYKENPHQVIEIQPCNHTYIYEAIYPNNKIVVNYQGAEMMPLIGLIDNITGRDLPPAYGLFNFPIVVQRYPFDSIDKALQHAQIGDAANQEGVVLCWYQDDDPAFRLKVKNADYLRIFKILYSLSSRTVWEHLAQGNSLDELLHILPVETHKWVNEVGSDLTTKYEAIVEEAKNHFNDVMKLMPSADLSSNREFKAAFAKIAKGYPDLVLLFMLADGKDIGNYIWEQLKPEYEKAYITTVDGELNE